MNILEMKQLYDELSELINNVSSENIDISKTETIIKDMINQNKLPKEFEDKLKNRNLISNKDKVDVKNKFIRVKIKGLPEGSVKTCFSPEEKEIFIVYKEDAYVFVGVKNKEYEIILDDDYVLTEGNVDLQAYNQFKFVAIHEIEVKTQKLNGAKTLMLKMVDEKGNPFEDDLGLTFSTGQITEENKLSLYKMPKIKNNYLVITNNSEIRLQPGKTLHKYIVEGLFFRLLTHKIEDEMKQFVLSDILSVEKHSMQTLKIIKKPKTSKVKIKLTKNNQPIKDMGFAYQKGTPIFSEKRSFKTNDKGEVKLDLYIGSTNVLILNSNLEFENDRGLKVEKKNVNNPESNEPPYHLFVSVLNDSTHELKINIIDGGASTGKSPTGGESTGTKLDEEFKLTINSNIDDFIIIRTNSDGKSTFNITKDNDDITVKVADLLIFPLNDGFRTIKSCDGAKVVTEGVVITDETKKHKIINIVFENAPSNKPPEGPIDDKPIKPLTPKPKTYSLTVQAFKQGNQHRRYGGKVVISVSKDSIPVEITRQLKKGFLTLDDIEAGSNVSVKLYHSKKYFISNWHLKKDGVLNREANKNSEGTPEFVIDNNLTLLLLIKEFKDMPTGIDKTPKPKGIEPGSTLHWTSDEMLESLQKLAFKLTEIEKQNPEIYGELITSHNNQFNNLIDTLVKHHENLNNLKNALKPFENVTTDEILELFKLTEKAIKEEYVDLIYKMFFIGMSYINLYNHHHNNSIGLLEGNELLSSLVDYHKNKTERNTIDYKNVKEIIKCIHDIDHKYRIEEVANYLNKVFERIKTNYGQSSYKSPNNSIVSQQKGFSELKNNIQRLKTLIGRTDKKLYEKLKEDLTFKDRELINYVLINSIEKVYKGHYDYKVLNNSVLELLSLLDQKNDGDPLHQLQSELIIISLFKKRVIPGLKDYVKNLKLKISKTDPKSETYKQLKREFSSIDEFFYVEFQHYEKLVKGMIEELKKGNMKEYDHYMSTETNQYKHVHTKLRAYIRFVDNYDNFMIQARKLGAVNN